ncbi:hypothetical protein SEPCBS57363_005591 [Sporothrix epigloea]|uniref:Transcription initiation factor TFIID subunit 4 n=1 Tax=Sporothrix epigloea TaxID=1892477 RepID=A0ABP0E0C2_9PEZI
MAQSQPQVAQRTFSPALQSSPSPVPLPGGFSGPPPPKKQRLSPAPSPTGTPQSLTGAFSPTATNGLNSTHSPATPSTPKSLKSPEALSSANYQPANTATPLPLPTPALPPAAASPMPILSPLPNSGQLNNVSTAAEGDNSPSNPLVPSTTPTPPTPFGPLTPSSALLPQLARAGTPGPITSTNGNYFATAAATPVVQTPAGGAMGPPSKPPTKEYQYDVDDSLAGTGIDLRQEEQFQADYFAGTYRPEARTGFPANTPGARGSFYGSLSANQPAETIDEANQRKIELETAKHVWADAARTLASTRSSALHNRFLEFGSIFLRAEKIANEYGVSVIMDPKAIPPVSSRSRQELEFQKPSVTVQTKKGPDGVSFISTTQTYIPEDSYLADQLALLSLATKHRLRELLEDANKVAETRQKTSHGVVEDDWLDAAAPLSSAGTADASRDDEEGGGEEQKKSLKSKGPFEAESMTDRASVAKKIAAGNTLIQSLRQASKTDRSIEEQRLLKRQKREGKKSDTVAPATPTANRSTTPGTPGSVAPDMEKPPTKKELRKNAAAKFAEQNDTLSANRTSMAFLGGRKKQYSWLSGGAGASPKRGLGITGSGVAGGGAGGGASGVAGGGAAGGGSDTPGRRPGESAMLTSEGRTKWGSWREDGIKGKDIQLRDLVVALEADGREAVALQTAYNRLDGTQFKA